MGTIEHFQYVLKGLMCFHRHGGVDDFVLIDPQDLLDAVCRIIWDPSVHCSQIKRLGRWVYLRGPTQMKFRVP